MPDFRYKCIKVSKELSRCISIWIYFHLSNYMLGILLGQANLGCFYNLDSVPLTVALLVSSKPGNLLLPLIFSTLSLSFLISKYSNMCHGKIQTGRLKLPTPTSADFLHSRFQGICLGLDKSISTMLIVYSKLC